MAVTVVVSFGVLMFNGHSMEFRYLFLILVLRLACCIVLHVYTNDLGHISRTGTLALGHRLFDRS